MDHYLVEQGLVESRNKAQQLIKDKKVVVNDRVITKSAFKIDGEVIQVLGDDLYVSRAALKLKSFLPLLPFTCKDMNALDIGSSTGGFSEVLLEEGVLHVDAVDVGRDQLHSKLRDDARVSSYEQTDIREFKSDKHYDIVTSDVSFISLTHILDDVDRLAAMWIVLLFKPQFEVGREAKRDNHGVVKDDKAIGKAMLQFEDSCSIKGWELITKEEAHIRGKEGNIEYCYCYKRN
ncbi:MAG: TlyA family RNA methyltransferase [Campylobacterota bacterium]|nr:TlyA family RNA methyltransferase [Campylobacterota bacterium]